MKHLKLLLLQARLTEDPMKDHERACFVRHLGLEDSQVVPHDLLQGPPAEWRRFDALLVGGAGDFYVSKGNLPQYARVRDFFREVVERGHPMFASCFGYHCLIDALGGELLFDGENTEVGTYRLTLTKAGAADPLFGTLPGVFWAQEGHKDRATRNPDGVPNLASSANSPFQALRIPGQPIWSTQFHPELDLEANLHRFRHYMDGYAQHMSAEEREEAFGRFRKSVDTDGLLPEFLRVVFA